MSLLAYRTNTPYFVYYFKYMNIDRNFYVELLKTGFISACSPLSRLVKPLLKNLIAARRQQVFRIGSPVFIKSLQVTQTGTSPSNRFQIPRLFLVITDTVKNDICHGISPGTDAVTQPWHSPA